jgi:antitoxin of RelE/RelB toxin-antitoxin system
MASQHEMIATIPLSEARSNLSALYDTAVEGGRPVRIHRRGDADAVLMARDQLRDLVGAYVSHVHVIPEAEAGGYTLWIDELNIGEYGDTLPEARDALLVAVRDYVRDYLERYNFYRHFRDKAAHYPYVLRLSLAQDDADLKQLLFAPMDPPYAAQR